MLNSIVNDPPAPLSSSPSAFVKELIKMLLNKDPELRPTTDKLMKD
jgi:hypothetical protein